MKLLVNKYKTEIEQMRARMRQLNNDFSRQNELLMECTEKTENPSYKKIHNYCLLAKDLRDREIELENAIVEIERLRKKNGEDRISQLLKESEEYKSKNSDLVIANEELKRHQERYIQEINDLEVKNQEFAHIIEDNKKEILKIKEITSRNHEHKAEISKLKEDMSSLSERNQDSVGKIKELSKQNYEKTSEIAKLKKELEDLIASSQAELSEKAKVTEALWTDISDLEEKHIASDDKILELQKEINHQKSENDKLRKDFELKSSTSQQEEISKAKLVEELKQHIKNLEDINKSENAKMQELSKSALDDKAEYDKTIKDLNTNIKSLKDSNEILEKSSHSNYSTTVLQNLHLSTNQLFLICPAPLISEDLKHEYLSHISFSLQLSRIDKAKLPLNLFGSGHNPELPITPQELSSKFKNPPFLFIKKYPQMIDKISEFLFQCSNSNKNSVAHIQIKKISQTLNELLPAWDILTEKEEEVFDRELSRLVCSNVYELQRACMAYDKGDAGVILISEFNSAMDSLKLLLSDRTKNYCYLLFYSTDYEVGKVPYKSFFQAYARNFEKLLAEDIEYIAEAFFKKIAGKLKNIKKANITAAFSFKDKLISVDEFKSGSKKLGIYILPDVIQLIFKFFKYEKDGKPVLQYKEFKKELKKYESGKKSKSSRSSSSEKSSKNSKKNISHSKEPEKNRSGKDVKPVEKQKESKKQSSSEADSYYTSSDQNSKISSLAKERSSSEKDSYFSSKANDSKIKNSRIDKGISEEESYSSSSEKQSKAGNVTKKNPEIELDIAKKLDTEEKFKIKEIIPTASQKASRRYSDASSKEEIEEKQEVITKHTEKLPDIPKSKNNTSETINDSSKTQENPSIKSISIDPKKQSKDIISEKQISPKSLLPEIINKVNPPKADHGFVVSSQPIPSYSKPPQDLLHPTTLKLPSESAKVDGEQRKSSRHSDSSYDERFEVSDRHYSSSSDSDDKNQKSVQIDSKKRKMANHNQAKLDKGHTVENKKNIQIEERKDEKNKPKSVGNIDSLVKPEDSEKKMSTVEKSSKQHSRSYSSSEEYESNDDSNVSVETRKSKKKDKDVSREYDSDSGVSSNASFSSSEEESGQSPHLMIMNSSLVSNDIFKKP